MRTAAWAVTAALSAMLGCSATVVRTYEEPLGYVRFAAQEASATAGFEPTRVETNELQGERSGRAGLLIGQGGENIRIRMTESGGSTRAEITSRKRFFGFFAGRHQHERVAGYLDHFIVSDRDLRDRIVGASP